LFYKGKKMSCAAAPDTDFHGFGEAIREELAKRIPSRGNLRVLDVGTGRGANAIFLTHHLTRGSKVWTVDPSDEVLVNTRVGLNEWQASRIEFLRANAERLEFKDDFFDIVVSVMLMHHTEDPQPSISEMARVLRGNGRLLIVDYKPEASHRLEFQSRHEEADFFEPEFIRAAAERAGLKPRARDYGLWYLVEASK
jgi:ArsR family transcriptional regulator